MLTEQFLFAGKATFTLEIPASFAEANKTPLRYTYRIAFKKGDGKRWGDTYFVSLLTGPDNEASYTYMGIINPEGGQFRITAKSAYPLDSMPVRLFVKVMMRVALDEQDAIEAAGFKLHHEGKCGRCGRLLTVPESIESGVGPECARQMGCERVAADIRDRELVGY